MFRYRRLLVLVPAFTAALVAMVASLHAKAGRPAFDQQVSDGIQEATCTVVNRFARGEAGALQVVERLAADYRSTGRRLPGGEWYLSYFYGWTAACLDVPPRLERIAQWKREHVKSPAPYLVEAVQLISEGFGGAHGSLGRYVENPPPVADVSALHRAKALLLESKALSSTDPHWYVLIAQIAVGGGMDEAEFTVLMTEGLKRFPEYVQLYSASADYYLPKWNGDADSLEAWARTVEKTIGGSAGRQAYARLYMHAHRVEYGDGLYLHSRANKATMKAGLADITEQPTSIEMLNWAGYASCLAGDADETLRMMHKIDRHTLPFIWGGAESLRACYRWAILR
jgi:hypothetical protein